jgi:pimeloyl-ACP methyl ester carboxylesterase
MIFDFDYSAVLENTSTINIIVGALLPALVALVTAKVASPRVKAFVLLAAASLSSVLVEALADGVFAWTEALSQFVVVWPTAVLTHYGFLKPVGVSGTDGAIQSAVPGGIGNVAQAVDENVSAELAKETTPVDVVVAENEAAEQELYTEVEANNGGTGI